VSVLDSFEARLDGVQDPRIRTTMRALIEAGRERHTVLQDLEEVGAMEAEKLARYITYHVWYIRSSTKDQIKSRAHALIGMYIQQREDKEARYGND
jgi:predicted type IV restriction endonuclease